MTDALTTAQARTAISNLSDHCDVDAELVRREYYRASDGIEGLHNLLLAGDQTDPSIAALTALVAKANAALSATKLGAIL